MKTHACTLGTLATMIGCLSGLVGCSSAIAPAAAHAPIVASEAPPAASSCVVVQRGASGDVADTRIAEQWPQQNYGSSDASFAGKVGSGERDVLLGFSLPRVPEGAIVTKATLTLHKGVCGGSGVEIHRVTGDWNEKSTTWKSFAGAYDADVAAEMGVGIPGEPGAVSADVTPLVRSWMSGEAPNHGVLLHRGKGNTSFSTSEAESPAERPRLEVCFSVPQG